MERIRKSRLEHLAAEVGKQLGRPTQAYGEYVPGEGVRANVGALHLNHAAVYGGWDLVEMVNTGGGEHSLIGNTFAGRGRLKAHEMESFLLGMLAAIERMRSA